MAKISLDWRDLAGFLPFFKIFSPNSRCFPNNQPRPRPDHFPTGTVRSDLIFWLVSGGSKNLEPDLVGSVASWAQTWPGPTRGHPYEIDGSKIGSFPLKFEKPDHTDASFFRWVLRFFWVDLASFEFSLGRFKLDPARFH